MRLRKARQPERFADADLFQEASTIPGSDRGEFPCVPAHRRAGVPGVLWRIENWRFHEIRAHSQQADPNLRPRRLVGLRHSAYEAVRRSIGFVVGARALEEAAARSRG